GPGSAPLGVCPTMLTPNPQDTSMTKAPAKKTARAKKVAPITNHTQMDIPELPEAGNQSVAMSVRILDELAAFGQPIGVSELARRLNESKGRVHRHLATMRALGLVSQEAVTERYGLGWKIFQLGSAANESFGIRRIAEEHLVRLRD